MGKGAGGKSISSSGASAISYAPVQIGAKTSAEDFRPEWFNTALNGLFSMIKDQVVETFNAMGGGKGIAEQLTGLTTKGLQAYEEKAGRIADQMMVSFAQNVSPDEVKTFPLDKFIETSIKSVYDKAGNIFANPVLSSSELKTMIDANTQNLATQFRQQRRAIEQEINARGLAGPAAMEARERAEQAIAEGRSALATQTMANEFSQKYNRQLAALGTQQTAIGQAQAQTGQLAQRWLEQWKNKLTAESLRQQGLQLQLGSLGLASGLEQQQWSNLGNMANNIYNMGTGFLSQVNQQAIDEYKAHIAAYGGAGSSSSWQTSESRTPGQYSSPLNLWGGWST